MRLQMPLQHGGVRLKKRKTARPLDLDRPILVILRSERALGDWSLLQKVNQKKVRSLLGFSAARFSIEILKIANFGRQLQLLIRARSRVSFQNFLRIFAGALALEITGAKRGVKQGRFWSHLAYSRVVESAKMVRHVLDHVMEKLFDFSAIEQRELDLFNYRAQIALKL